MGIKKDVDCLISIGGRCSDPATYIDCSTCTIHDACHSNLFGVEIPKDILALALYIRKMHYNYKAVLFDAKL